MPAVPQGKDRIRVWTDAVTPPFVRVRPDLLARLYAEPPTVGRRYSMPLVAVTVAGLADRALRPCDGQDFPTIGELSRVVGWSTTAVSNLLTDPDRWCHADSIEAWRRYWTFTAAARLPKKRAVEVASPVILGCDLVATDLSVGTGSTDVLAVKVVTRLPLTCRSVATRKLYARGSRGRARTDLQTDRPSEDKNKGAPVSVADLFTPSSQPDAATGEATGDTAPPPSCAAPLPADVLAVVSVLAKLNHRSAERMTRGTNDGMVKATRKAIKALGLPALLARLEYASAAQDDEPMKFWRTTLGGKLAPMLTVDGPWVRGLDEAAADRVDEVQAAGGVDARAMAVEAWANMTFDVRWKHVVQKPPNLVGDFGNPDRWDLADTAPEHDRRMACFKTAGSIPKWRDADLEGRRQFRERWLELYAKEVTA